MVDWNQKTLGLSKLANKYLDTLEEYKMMFVQMKQYLKEKDAMVFKTRTQMLAQRESHKEHVKRIEKELLEANQDTLSKLKEMTTTLEKKLVTKENQCDQLIRYQEEFREEYLKVCANRDDLHDRNAKILG